MALRALMRDIRKTIPEILANLKTNETLVLQTHLFDEKLLRFLPSKENLVSVEECTPGLVSIVSARICLGVVSIIRKLLFNSSPFLTPTRNLADKTWYRLRWRGVKN